ncbi:hypothetical protein R1sor_006109 [Riccia sorocarpa]|uniref:Uncharacterized protein n=1 Tax=Riccia sorocarpa TaxID=122646 RepID=A0ABD3HM31_9MARC
MRRMGCNMLTPLLLLKKGLTPHVSHGVYGYLLLAPGVVAPTPCVAWGVNFFPHLSSRVSSDHPMRRMGFTSFFSLYFWSSILIFVPYSLMLPSLVIQKDRSCSNSITKALFGVDEPEPEGGKRKGASKAKSLVQVLPPEFLDHIDSARAYKEAKEAGRAVLVPEQNFKHWVKEGSLQSVKWDVFHGNVPGSAGTGGREADDGIEDPEGIDPEVRAEEAEEEVPEHERNLGQEGIVPDFLVAE